MLSQEIKAVIDTTALNQEPIQEAIEESLGSGKTKRFVSQIQLRSVTNGFGSRSESGQANLGLIGNVMRGQISNNARTRAVRLAMPQFTDLSNVWEIRGRNIGQTILKRLVKECPDTDIALLLQVARAAAFVGVSSKKSEGKAQKEFDAAVEQYLDDPVSDPWDVLPKEDTIQVVSIFDIMSLIKLINEKEARCVKNKLLSELTIKELWKEVANVYENGGAGLPAACFGAMKADLPLATITGGVSINQSFTTSAAQMKPSLFTAVSDERETDVHAGAQHLGMKELNSGVFCEPALVNVEQMVENLYYLDKAQFKEAMTAMYRALALTTPDGGQRAHLTRSFPEIIVNVISNLQPISFESAYVKPIEGGSEEGDMAESAQQLVNHLIDFQSFMGIAGRDYDVVLLGTPTVMSYLDSIPANWIVVSTLDEMIEKTNELTGV